MSLVRRPAALDREQPERSPIPGYCSQNTPMGFVVGLLFRLAALAVVLWAAVIPLSLFILRAREGLHEEK